MRFFAVGDKQARFESPGRMRLGHTVWAARKRSKGSPSRLSCLLFMLQPVPFPLEVLTPGPRDFEDAALVGALLLGEADASVAIAGTCLGKSDPEEEPVGPLARTGASDGNAGHGDIMEGGRRSELFVNGSAWAFVPRREHAGPVQFIE